MRNWEDVGRDRRACSVRFFYKVGTRAIRLLLSKGILSSCRAWRNRWKLFPVLLFFAPFLPFRLGGFKRGIVLREEKIEMLK